MALDTMKAGSALRKQASVLLEHEGNFRHNAKVIENGEGELVVKRRPGGTELRKFAAIDYIPCQFCCGFLFKYNYRKHVQTSCCMRPHEQVKYHPSFVINSRLMLAPFVKLAREEKKKIYDEILEGMRVTEKSPDVRKMCQEDSLLLEFGMALLEELTDPDQRRKNKELVKSQCRLVGVVLKRLNDKQAHRHDLSFFICGQHFEAVVKSLESLSEECKSPSVAEKLANYFHQICLLKLSMAMAACDEQLIEEALDFKKMHETYWNPCIKSIPKDELQNLTIDIVSLKIMLQSSIDEALKDKEPSVEQWMAVAEKVLALVCLTNKVDNAKLAEAEISHFLVRPTIEDLDVLTCPVKILASRLEVRELRGKSSRDLPNFILLTPGMMRGLNYLVETRHQARVNTQNQVLFYGDESGYMDGDKTLQQALNSASSKLKCPESLAKILGDRTYLSTLSQLLEMNQAELKKAAGVIGCQVSEEDHTKLLPKLARDLVTFDKTANPVFPKIPLSQLEEGKSGRELDLEESEPEEANTPDHEEPQDPAPTMFPHPVMSDLPDVKPRLKPASRFAKVTDEEIEDLQHASKSAKTHQQTQWGVNVFREWLRENLLDEDFLQLTEPELGEHLKRFFAEVRNKDNEMYSRSSLYCIRGALQRYITSPPHNLTYNLITGPQFIAANNVIAGTVREMKLKGIRVAKTHGPISKEDIKKMYNSGVLGDDNPRSLLFKVFFELSLHFGRRGRDSLREMRREHISFQVDEEGTEYATLSLKRRKRGPAPAHDTEPVQRMYATGGSHCPVQSLKKFISLLNPDCTALFQKPMVKDYQSKSVWYCASPIGVNTLARFMATISVAAGLSQRYTNHCIRVTTVSLMT